MGTDHTISPAAIEFQRALIFSFTVRQNHGHIAPAFQEFIMEPDIVEHWKKLGPDTVTEMVTSAVHLVHETKKRGGGGDLKSLPTQILTNEKYAPLADAAQILLDSASSDGPTVADAECARFVHEIDTPNRVALFAILVMTIFPAPRDENNDLEIE